MVTFRKTFKGKLETGKTGNPQEPVTLSIKSSNSRENSWLASKRDNCPSSIIFRKKNKTENRVYSKTKVKPKSGLMYSWLRLMRFLY